MAVEALGSAVAGELVSQTVSSFSEWYDRGSDSEDKMKKIEMYLRKIRSVIEMANRKHISNRSLGEWLKEIKKEADEIETLLHNLKTQALDNRGIFRNVIKFLPFNKTFATRKLTDASEQIEELSFHTDDFVKLLELEKCQPVLSGLTREMKIIQVFELKHDEKPFFVMNFVCNKGKFWDEFSLETRVSWCEFGAFCAQNWGSKLAKCMEKYREEFEARGFKS